MNRTTNHKHRRPIPTRTSREVIRSSVWNETIFIRYTPIQWFKICNYHAATNRSVSTVRMFLIVPKMQRVNVYNRAEERKKSNVRNGTREATPPRKKVTGGGRMGGSCRGCTDENAALLDKSAVHEEHFRTLSTDTKNE